MRRRRSLIVVGALLVVPLVFGTTTASAVTPGNNGTVKMDGLPLDNPDSPDNEPHIGCYFQVDFYGYDEGDLDATASLVLHPPTGGTGLALIKSTDIGEDPAGGGTDLDASILFTTDDLRPWIVANGSPTPHEIQGFHVKLTVNAEGSQGSDVKHKVFWIKCHDGALPGM
jgi:hypothetical protein